MTNPLKSESSRSLGLLLARLPIGAYFVLAGYSKVFGEGGVDAFVAKSLPAVPEYMPPWFGSNYLHALPYAEIALGSLLILGLLTRLSALAVTGMLVSFVIAYTGVKDPPRPFHANLIYVGLAAMFILTGPGKISLDGLLFGRRKDRAAARDQ